MVGPEHLSVNGLIAEAVDVLREGDSARARTLADRALSLAPNHPAARHAMGLVEMTDLNQTAARGHFEAAVAGEPNNPDYLVSFAYADITAGDFAPARAKLDRALSINPNCAAAYQNLAWITKAAPGDSMIDSMRALIAREG